MAHSDCGWTCGCAGKTVKFLENTCHTLALLQCWFTTKRRYIKCMHLYLTFTFHSSYDLKGHGTTHTDFVSAKYWFRHYIPVHCFPGPIHLMPGTVSAKVFTDRKQFFCQSANRWILKVENRKNKLTNAIGNEHATRDQTKTVTYGTASWWCFSRAVA